MDSNHNQRQRRDPSRWRYIFKGVLLMARAIYWLIRFFTGGGIG